MVVEIAVKSLAKVIGRISCRLNRYTVDEMPVMPVENFFIVQLANSQSCGR